MSIRGQVDFAKLEGDVSNGGHLSADNDENDDKK